MFARPRPPSRLGHPLRYDADHRQTLGSQDFPENTEKISFEDLSNARKKRSKNIKKHENKTIINCSSNEYFNVINQKNLEGNILNTVFKEYRDGELKFISFNAKKARGLLAKFIINNNTY